MSYVSYKWTQSRSSFTAVCEGICRRPSIPMISEFCWIKLIHYGFQTTPLKWFNSYLKNNVVSMLIMMVPHWKSVPLQMAFHILKMCPITNGIPHIENLSHYKWHSTYWKSVPLQTAFHKGPFLGPLLIIIYIKDIHKASSNFKTISYADDTNLISPLFV